MDDKYKALREKICADETELSRFRELIINGVMATDLLDKDLKKLRNVRWEMAFKETPVTYSNKFILRVGEDLMSHADTEAATAPPDETLLDIESFNRKATIVIEHLIQASDVAHTMQVRISYAFGAQSFCYCFTQNVLPTLFFEALGRVPRVE